MIHRRLWRLAFALIAVCCLFAHTLVAQPATPPATQPANSATAFLDQLTPEHGTVLVLQDPLPHVQRLLNAPSLRRVMTQGKLRDWVMAMPDPPASLDPADLWTLIDQNRRWVPQQIVVALPDTTWESINHIIGAVLTGSLTNAAKQLDNEDGRKALPDLQKQFLAEMQALRVPEITVYAQLRDEGDAIGVMNMLVMQAESVRRESPVPLKIDTTSVAVDFKLGDVVQEELIGAFLAETGAFADPASPEAKATIDALAGLHVQSSIRRAGSALVFRIGAAPAPGAPRLKADRFEGMLDARPDAISASIWNIGGFTRGLKRLADTWRQWHDTPVGRKLVELDTEDVISSLTAMDEQMRVFAARGVGRAWAEGSAVRFVSRGQEFAPAPSLAQTKVLELVPADVEAYQAESVMSLADRLVGTMMDFEGRLEMQTMRDDARAETAQRTIDAYYKHFGPARQVILKRAPEVFKPGTVYFSGLGGKITKFEAEFNIGNERTAIRGENLPVIEFVVVAKVSGADEARKMMNDLWSAVVNGAYAANGVQPEPGAKLGTKEIDLALGVPTFGFETDWIAKLSGGGKLKLDVQGDWQPHFFITDDVMVFSTSAGMSRRVMDAKRGKTARLSLPVQGDAQLVEAAHYTGRFMQQLFDALAAWATMFGRNLEPANAPPQQAVLTNMGKLIEGIGEIAGLVDVAEWTTSDRGDIRSSEGQFKFIPN